MRDETAYGPENPHPLSTMKTELVWEGKYDEYGNRREADVAGLLRESRGKVDLIYIDPLFDVGADFTLSLPIGEGTETLDKDQSILEAAAYRDMWGRSA